MSHSGCAPARGRGAPISVSVDTPDARTWGLVLSPPCPASWKEEREGVRKEEREGQREETRTWWVHFVMGQPEPLKGVDLQFPRHLERQVVLSSEVQQFTQGHNVSKGLSTARDPPECGARLLFP